MKGRVVDAGWREANALVDHLDARIARGDGDLLGPFAVAVEAGLAGQHLQAAAEVALERLLVSSDDEGLRRLSGQRAAAAP